jgi:hypothetical protein
VDFPGRREIVAVAGYPSHGKTVYLSVLLWKLLFDAAPHFGPNAYLNSCDDPGLRLLYLNAGQLAGGVLPEATPVCFPEPTMILVENLADHQWGDVLTPRSQSVLLMLYDQSGEAFQPGFDPSRHGLRPEEGARIERYFALARTVWLFYSPPNVVDGEEGESLLSLLNRYQLWATHIGGSEVTKNQRVVVIYTKADLMTPWLQHHYPVLHARLVAEPQAPDREYIRNALPVYSRLLADLTRRLPGGEAFQTKCAADFRGVEYALVSALGAPPVYDPANPASPRLPRPCTPRCLADPLLLTLRP